MRHQRTFLASVLLLSSAIPALAAEQAGVSAAVQGQVALTRPQGAVGAQVKSGEEIFLQDEIRSGARSGMQILLLDETVFTIGPESEIRVDEFVYDPKTSAGKVTVGVTKGVFRFVTGRVARKNPADMNVNLPSGTIGVRGTMVAGRTDPVTKASVAVLLGEGDENDTGSPAGAIQVCNAGQCETARRAGYAISIDAPDAAPSKPFPMPLPQIQSITSAVSDPEGVVESAAAGAGTPDVAAGGAANDGDPRPAGDVAGEGTAAALKTAERFQRRLDARQELDGLTSEAAQDITDSENIRDLFVEGPSGLPPELLPDLEIPELPSDFTSYGQLAGLGEQVALYQAFELGLTDGESTIGSYNFRLEIDVLQRSASLEFNNISAYDSSLGRIAGGRTLTGQANEPMVFGVQGGVGGSSSLGCPNGCQAAGTAVVRNLDGRIGGVAQQFLTVFDNPDNPTRAVVTEPSDLIVPRSSP